MIHNAPHPAGLAAWRALEDSGAQRIIQTKNHQLGVDDSVGSAVKSLFPSFICSDYVADNKAAYNNLFSSIHQAYPTRSDSVQELLQNDFDEGKPLTAEMVKRAISTTNSAATLCAKWDAIANEDRSNLSPRVPAGQTDSPGAKLAREFSLLVSDRFAQADTHTNADKLAVLGAIKSEIENTKSTFQGGIQHKLLSLVALEIQRYTCAAKIRESDMKQLSSMTDPERDVWRLLMDGRDQGNGIQHFENERGYMAGMLGGLNLMIDTLRQPLSSDLYLNFHDAAVNGVHTRIRGDDSEFFIKYPNDYLMEKGYRDRRVGFPIEIGDNGTQEGIDAFDTAGKNDWCIIETVHDFDDGISTRLVAQYPMSLLLEEEANPTGREYEAIIQEACHAKAAEIIDNYNQEIALVNSSELGPADKEEKILTSIAKCCQDLDQHHLFTDGNIRTIAFLVMNKLLLENDLSPTIFHDPNAIDMHSVPQIVDLIRAGQTTYQNLCG
jgi:prophage maintenance system killer protein